MIFSTRRARIAIISLCAAALTAAQMVAQIFYFPGPDIAAHVRIAIGAAADGVWHFYSLIYVILAGLTFNSTNYTTVGIAMIVVMSSAVAARAVFTAAALNDFHHKWWGLITVALLVAMPIYNPMSDTIYLGQITPTVWHNSTTILAAPFAIALFYSALRFMRNASLSTANILTIMGVLSTLAKPNFAIALFPALGIACFILGTTKRKISVILLLAIPAVALAAVMYFQLVTTRAVVTASDADAGFILSFFGPWSLYSPNIPLSLLLSVAFPASVLLLSYGSVLADREAMFSWLVFLVALIQAAFLAESGGRLAHGNFFWGAHLALMILFITHAKISLTEKRRRHRTIEFGVLTLHVGSGIYYYVNFASGGGLY